MPSKKGGYKIVSLGGLDLTGENLSLKGLYNALKISYGKPIQLCGIIIDGESKKDALVQADEGANVINIKHLYGYNLSVSSEDAITVEVDSEGIELPVPTPEDDEKIVGVNVQGKYVLKPSVKEQIESGAVAGTIASALGLNEDGELVKGTVSGGGTKLYKHHLVSNIQTEIFYVDLLSPDSELDAQSLTIFLMISQQGQSTLPISKVINVKLSSTFQTVLYIQYIDFANSEIGYNNTLAFSDFTDTVTEL